MTTTPPTSNRPAIRRGRRGSRKRRKLAISKWASLQAATVQRRPPRTAIPQARQPPHTRQSPRSKSPNSTFRSQSVFSSSLRLYVAIFFFTLGQCLICLAQIVAVTAEFLVDSIDGLTSTGKISKEFVGIVLLPIVGNAAGSSNTALLTPHPSHLPSPEHVTAVTVSVKDKIDLSLGVAVGSSIVSSDNHFPSCRRLIDAIAASSKLPSSLFRMSSHPAHAPGTRR